MRRRRPHVGLLPTSAPGTASPDPKFRMRADPKLFEGVPHSDDFYTHKLPQQILKSVYDKKKSLGLDISKLKQQYANFIVYQMAIRQFLCTKRQEFGDTPDTRGGQNSKFIEQAYEQMASIANLPAELPNMEWPFMFWMPWWTNRFLMIQQSTSTWKDKWMFYSGAFCSAMEFLLYDQIPLYVLGTEVEPTIDTNDWFKELFQDERISKTNTGVDTSILNEANDFLAWRAGYFSGLYSVHTEFLIKKLAGLHTPTGATQSDTKTMKALLQTDIDSVLENFLELPIESSLVPDRTIPKNFFEGNFGAEQNTPPTDYIELGRGLTQEQVEHAAVIVHLDEKSPQPSSLNVSELNESLPSLAVSTISQREESQLSNVAFVDLSNEQFEMSDLEVLQNSADEPRVNLSWDDYDQLQPLAKFLQGAGFITFLVTNEAQKNELDNQLKHTIFLNKTQYTLVVADDDNFDWKAPTKTKNTLSVLAVTKLSPSSSVSGEHRDFFLSFDVVIVECQNDVWNSIQSDVKPETYIKERLDETQVYVDQFNEMFGRKPFTYVNEVLCTEPTDSVLFVFSNMAPPSTENNPPLRVMPVKDSGVVANIESKVRTINLPDTVLNITVQYTTANITDVVNESVNKSFSINKGLESSMFKNQIEKYVADYSKELNAAEAAAESIENNSLFLQTRPILDLSVAHSFVAAEGSQYLRADAYPATESPKKKVEVVGGGTQSSERNFQKFVVFKTLDKSGEDLFFGRSSEIETARTGDADQSLDSPEDFAAFAGLTGQSTPVRTPKRSFIGSSPRSLPVTPDTLRDTSMAATANNVFSINFEPHTMFEDIADENERKLKIAYFMAKVFDEACDVKNGIYKNLDESSFVKFDSETNDEDTFFLVLSATDFKAKFVKVTRTTTEDEVKAATKKNFTRLNLFFQKIINFTWNKAAEFPEVQQLISAAKDIHTKASALFSEDNPVSGLDLNTGVEVLYDELTKAIDDYEMDVTDVRIQLAITTSFRDSNNVEDFKTKINTKFNEINYEATHEELYKILTENFFFADEPGKAFLKNIDSIKFRVACVYQAKNKITRSSELISSEVKILACAEFMYLAKYKGISIPKEFTNEQKRELKTQLDPPHVVLSVGCKSFVENDQPLNAEIKKLWQEELKNSVNSEKEDTLIWTEAAGNTFSEITTQKTAERWNKYGFLSFVPTELDENKANDIYTENQKTLMKTTVQNFLESDKLKGAESGVPILGGGEGVGSSSSEVGGEGVGSSSSEIGVEAQEEEEPPQESPEDAERRQQAAQAEEEARRQQAAEEEARRQQAAEEEARRQQAAEEEARRRQEARQAAEMGSGTGPGSELELELELETEPEPVPGPGTELEQEPEAAQQTEINNERITNIKKAMQMFTNLQSAINVDNPIGMNKPDLENKVKELEKQQTNLGRVIDKLEDLFNRPESSDETVKQAESQLQEILTVDNVKEVDSTITRLKEILSNMDKLKELETTLDALKIPVNEIAQKVKDAKVEASDVSTYLTLEENLLLLIQNLKENVEPIYEDVRAQKKFFKSKGYDISTIETKYKPLKNIITETFKLNEDKRKLIKQRIDELNLDETAIEKGITEISKNLKDYTDESSTGYKPIKDAIEKVKKVVTKYSDDKIDEILNQENVKKAIDEIAKAIPSTDPFATTEANLNKIEKEAKTYKSKTDKQAIKDKCDAFRANVTAAKEKVADLKEEFEEETRKAKASWTKLEKHFSLVPSNEEIINFKTLAILTIPDYDEWKTVQLDLTAKSDEAETAFEEFEDNGNVTTLAKAKEKAQELKVFIDNHEKSANGTTWDKFDANLRELLDDVYQIDDTGQKVPSYLLLNVENELQDKLKALFPLDASRNLDFTAPAAENFIDKCNRQYKDYKSVLNLVGGDITTPASGTSVVSIIKPEEIQIIPYGGIWDEIRQQFKVDTPTPYVPLTQSLADNTAVKLPNQFETKAWFKNNIPRTHNVTLKQGVNMRMTSKTDGKSGIQPRGVHQPLGTGRLQVTQI